MANSYKVLGQTANASTAVDLYTVPASTEAVVSLAVNVRGSSTRTATVSVRDGGATQADEHELCTTYDFAPGPHVFDVTITMSATDVLTVEASSSDVTFQAFGTEIT